MNPNAKPYTKVSHIPEFEPSIHIGRVHANIDKETIFNTFSVLNIGSIGSIEIIKQGNKRSDKQSDKQSGFNRVIVHLNYWYNNGPSTETRERLLSGKEVKIVYNDPWFWKVTAFRPSKPKSKPIPNALPKPAIRIEFDDEAAPGKIAPTLSDYPAPKKQEYKQKKQEYKPKKNKEKYNPKKKQEKGNIAPALFEQVPTPAPEPKPEPEPEPNPEEPQYYGCEDDLIDTDVLPEPDWSIDYGVNATPPPKKTRIPLKK